MPKYLPTYLVPYSTCSRRTAPTTIFGRPARLCTAGSAHNDGSGARRNAVRQEGADALALHHCWFDSWRR